MKKLFSELINMSKIKDNHQVNYISYYYGDQGISNTIIYHGFSALPKVENDYQQTNNNKRYTSIIDITSEALKYEYSKKLSSLNDGLFSIFILSILYLIDIFINLKYVKKSELSITILILSLISISIIIILLISIKLKILIDSYGYILFYLFSMIESLILLSLTILKIISFIFVFKYLNLFDCKNNYLCLGYFSYLLMLIFSIIIFAGNLIYSKFILLLFCDSFKIFIKKKKTFFQREIEIKEKMEKSGAIEFVEENDNINKSDSQINSNDSLKFK